MIIGGAIPPLSLWKTGFTTGSIPPRTRRGRAFGHKGARAFSKKRRSNSDGACGGVFATVAGAELSKRKDRT